MIENPKLAFTRKWVDGVSNPIEQIQQNGIDLTVENIAEIEGSGRVGVKEKSLPNYRQIQSQPTLTDGRVYRLEPGKAYVLQITETIKVPRNKVGLVWMRSTFNRCGCPLFACVFDSGYNGKPTIAAYPSIPIWIEKNARIAQILFFDADSASLYNGQYQHQGLKKK